MTRIIGVVGNGVVGKATGKAFAAKGVGVWSWDLNPLRSTHSLKDVISTKTVFVCLPTPAYPDGSCDTTVLQEFFVNGPRKEDKSDTTFVIRSTVPIGFTERIARDYGYKHLYHWPEFLTARTAEHDAANPRCIILGCPNGYDPDTFLKLTQLIRHCWPKYLNHGMPLRYVSSSESEAIKLFTNSWFAVKVTAFNELRMVSDKFGLDWNKVVAGMLEDGRIDPNHTQVPGPDGKYGFGGACLPKDLSSLIHHAARVGVAPHTFVAAKMTNLDMRDKPI